MNISVSRSLKHVVFLLRTFKSFMATLQRWLSFRRCLQLYRIFPFADVLSFCRLSLSLECLCVCLRSFVFSHSLIMVQWFSQLRILLSQKLRDLYCPGTRWMGWCLVNSLGLVTSIDAILFLEVFRIFSILGKRVKGVSLPGVGLSAYVFGLH